MVDEDGYELITRRIVWVFRMGWIGDCEGRTWSKELYAEARFPNREIAYLHMDNHPDVFKDPWGNYRTKYPHGQVGVFRIEEEVKN